MTQHQLLPREDSLMRHKTPQAQVNRALPSDLQHAYACADWVAIRLQEYSASVRRWCERNLAVEVRNFDTNPSDGIVTVIEKEPLPPAFGIEAAIYLNALRHALDMLAVALAQRGEVDEIDTVHFPISICASVFKSKLKNPNFWLNHIPQPLRVMMEEVKPYRGGNALLWLLYRLNAASKQPHLLRVDYTAASSRFSDMQKDFTPVKTGYVPTKDGIVIGFVPHGVHTVATVNFTLVFLDGKLPGNPAATDAMQDLAASVKQLIRQFAEAYVKA